MADDVAELVRWLSSAARTVVLTGAGVSVASGIRPFRGPGGLWTEHPELASEMVAGVSIDRMWEVFDSRREGMRLAAPNAAHHALVTLERAATGRGAAFTVITQNIDDLHARAGQRALLELHGNLFRARCSACDADAERDDSGAGRERCCVRCGGRLRPDVVLFDEPIGAHAEVMSKRAFRDADLFLAIGTSGTVAPASNFVRWARFEGARTAFVNLTGLEGSDPGYDLVVLGPADELVPRLVSPP